MHDEVLVLLSMLFLHVLDDFHLQGIMTGMKQRAWWKERTDDPKYAYDYIPVLLLHAFSWSFLVMLPLAAYHDFTAGPVFCAMLAANVMIHAAVDDLKANRLKINLIQDQLVHLAQILATYAVLILA